MKPLVSIIMPTYNAEPFIGEAIASVLAQDHGNWELLIVNDASTDGTADIIGTFSDPRIRVFHQPVNSGIGSARNVALEHVRGEFLCTFDSDDVMPQGSLSTRVAVLEHEPGVDIVDGRVIVLDRGLENVLRTFIPTFEGDSSDDLLSLSGKCFFGPSWMLRWRADEHLRFNTEVTHAEDLIFYICFAKGRRYKAVDVPVLHYRVTGHSAMSRFDGLERSYRYIEHWLRSRPDLADEHQVERFRRRWKSIMFRTWLKAGKPVSAVQVLFR